MNNKENSPLSNTDYYNELLSDNGFFLLILLVEVVVILYLISGRYLSSGHDGFQYFTLPYVFLNGAVNDGEIPQWSPFLTHGTMVTIGYTVANGIFQNVLFLFKGLLQSINFLPLFYIGLFVDELILITGVWLLGRRFFTSPVTVFFTTLSIMGSCIWLLQPLWNFHAYYAIPLLVFFLHVFMDTGKWRYAFLSGNLLFIQSLGSPPYFLPVISLVVFLYFVFFSLSNYEQVWETVRTLKFKIPFVFCMLTTATFFAFYYSLLNFGVDQFVPNVFRNPDSSVPLEVFLTYGGAFTWKQWLELCIGVSPCVDYTLYIGMLCIPLIALGIINVNKKNLHFLLVTITLLLFSMGGFVSIFFYYCWPMMNYFRHLVLIAPIIKVFLCFLAGFGFDSLFYNKSRGENPLVIKATLAAITIIMFSLAFVLWLMSCDILETDFIAEIIPLDAVSFRSLFINKTLLPLLLSRSALFALSVPLLFAAYPLIRRRKCFFPLLLVFLVLHAADMYGFKFFEIKMKTTPLTDELYKITEFQPMPYAKRRDLSFSENNPRASLLKTLPVVVTWGSFYSSIHAFLFKDQLGNPFRTDFWMLPLDQYMKAYWGQPIDDLSVKPRGLFYLTEKETPRLEFPQSHPAILKISGVTEDKIQFFAGAEFVSSEDEIASLITSSAYKGDIIFLSPFDNKKKESPVSLPVSYKKDLGANARLRLPYQVVHFDSNNLEVTTQNKDGAAGWMFYSDVWHPLWRATVNGKQVPVYKANLAYKAVKLDRGFNKVHFYFKSGFVSLAYYVVGVNAFVWLIIIFFLAGSIVLNRGGILLQGNKDNNE